LKDFSYAAPATLRDAAKLLAEANGRARILAGGTDILVQLREGLRDADLVVDVKKIPELMELSYSAAKGLRLGASVPCYRIYDDAVISLAYPALTDAAQIVGGWQIQSRASVGGNLCNSSPAADTIPALIAHGVTAVVAGPTGQRDIKTEDFCTGPGTNQLHPGELLVTLVFPPAAPRCSSAYERFIPRNEMDIAVAGAASWVQLSADGKTVEKARIGLCAVAPTPKFAAEASQWLTGKPATEESFAQAGELAKKVASPITDMRGTVEYRVHLVGVLAKRTLARAVERARAS
jgi:xanthine dehydrogenase FAD-binding subunit